MQRVQNFKYCLDKYLGLICYDSKRLKTCYQYNCFYINPLLFSLVTKQDMFKEKSTPFYHSVQTQREKTGGRWK